MRAYLPDYTLQRPASLQACLQLLHDHPGRFRRHLSAARRTQRHASAQPRIGLVLGGGGARGFAHVGVLQVLNKHSGDFTAWRHSPGRMRIQPSTICLLDCGRATAVCK